MINRKIVDIYKILVPAFLRNKITLFRNAGGTNTIRKNIINYYSSPGKPNTAEIEMVLAYLRKNPLALFPYNFTAKYQPSAIKVYYDSLIQLNYILHEGKRMYYKQSLGEKAIRENYTNLLIEQDKDSPHCYLTDNFCVEANCIVADVGAAEGIFALSVIEQVKKIYLFEKDQEWIEALQATFAPWSDKVVIVNKFVSDKNDEDNITIDQFCENEGILPDFIKIDVDGAEYDLLNGAHQVLSAIGKLKIAICTYHQSGDEDLFKDLFKKYNIDALPSNGYMIFFYDPLLSAPYLRRGLLRGTKH